MHHGDRVPLPRGRRARTPKTTLDTRFTNRACHPVAGYAATRMCAGSKCINHRHDHADTDIAASLATAAAPPRLKCTPHSRHQHGAWVLATMMAKGKAYSARFR